MPHLLTSIPRWIYFIWYHWKIFMIWGYSRDTTNYSFIFHCHKNCFYSKLALLEQLTSRFVCMRDIPKVHPKEKKYFLSLWILYRKQKFPNYVSEWTFTLLLVLNYLLTRGSSIFFSAITAPITCSLLSIRMQRDDD